MLFFARKSSVPTGTRSVLRRKTSLSRGTRLFFQKKQHVPWYTARFRAKKGRVPLGTVHFLTKRCCVRRFRNFFVTKFRRDRSTRFFSSRTFGVSCGHPPFASDILAGLATPELCRPEIGAVLPSPNLFVVPPRSGRRRSELVTTKYAKYTKTRITDSNSLSRILRISWFLLNPVDHGCTQINTDGDTNCTNFHELTDLTLLLSTL